MAIDWTTSINWPSGALSRVTLVGAWWTALALLHSGGARGRYGASLLLCSTIMRPCLGMHTQYTTSVICPRISAGPRQWLRSLGVGAGRTEHPHLVPGHKGPPLLAGVCAKATLVADGGSSVCHGLRANSEPGGQKPHHPPSGYTALPAIAGRGMAPTAYPRVSPSTVTLLLLPSPAWPLSLPPQFSICSQVTCTDTT